MKKRQLNQIQSLRKGQILTFTNCELNVEMRSGVIWLTLAGDRKDYVIADQESARFKSNARIVIEALEDCRLVYWAQASVLLDEATQEGSLSIAALLNSTGAGEGATRAASATVDGVHEQF